MWLPPRRNSSQRQQDSTDHQSREVAVPTACVSTCRALGIPGKEMDFTETLTVHLSSPRALAGSEHPESDPGEHQWCPSCWSEHPSSAGQSLFGGRGSRYSKCYRKKRCVRLLTTQKLIPARLVERKVCFISDASDWGWGRADVGAKADSPTPTLPTGLQWDMSFYRQKERATCRNSTVSSDSYLQIGHWWSDQHHLGCFRHS